MQENTLYLSLIFHIMTNWLIDWKKLQCNFSVVDKFSYGIQGCKHNILGSIQKQFIWVPFLSWSMSLTQLFIYFLQLIEPTTVHKICSGYKDGHKLIVHTTFKQVVIICAMWLSRQFEISPHCLQSKQLPNISLNHSYSYTELASCAYRT